MLLRELHHTKNHVLSLKKPPKQEHFCKQEQFSCSRLCQRQQQSFSSSSSPSSPSSPLMALPIAKTAAEALVQQQQSAMSLFPNSQFVLGFLVGGLFCSTVIASAIAYASFGAENFKRLMKFRRTVFGHVWGIFWLGLGAAQATLLGDDKWRWREAWRVLKKRMNDTKRAAQEGAKAIRLEANLYAATIGKPGLVSLQYLVNHFTPKLLGRQLEESLQETLQTIKDQNVHSIKLLDFSVGKKPPELLDARAYELGDDAMAFDLDIKWKSEVEATMSLEAATRMIVGGMRVPITVRNVNFDGVIRVVLSPLTPDPPGFGAALVSLPVTPTIGLDVRMAGGEITKMPWLRSEILNSLQKSVEDQFLWPRRMVIPSPKPPRRRKKQKTMLSQRQLKALEYDDPLLQAERKLAHDLDSLHHYPPLEHEVSSISSSTNSQEEDAFENHHHSGPVHMDVKLKDIDCIETLEEAEEDLCIIDWEAFEIAASSINKGYTNPRSIRSFSKGIESRGSTRQRNPLMATLRSNFRRT